MQADWQNTLSTLPTPNYQMIIYLSASSTYYYQQLRIGSAHELTARSDKLVSAIDEDDRAEGSQLDLRDMKHKAVK